MQEFNIEDLEDVVCDYCHNQEKELLVKQQDKLHKRTEHFFSLVRCQKCQLSYTSPRPKEEDIGHFYSADYAFYDSQSRGKKLAIKVIKKLIQYRFACALLSKLTLHRLALYIYPDVKDPLKKWIEKGNKQTSFLDIGHGRGEHAHFWGEEASLKSYAKKIQVFGVEPAKTPREALQKEGFTIYSSINDVEASLKFDLIRMNWSLEHVHSPKKYFSFLKEHLNEKGRILICIPNYDGMIYRLFPKCLELPVHLYHFRRKDVENYAHDEGLEIEHFESFSYPGMYRYSGEIFPELEVFKKMTLLEAYDLQKSFKYFDNVGLGNDMFLILRHKNKSGATLH